MAGPVRFDSFQAHHDEQELPPVPELVLEGYEPKGAWKQMGDWRVYVVRSPALPSTSFHPPVHVRRRGR